MTPARYNRDMRYTAKEFIRYVQCFDDGCEGDTGFSERKLDFYERLRDWIESRASDFSSLAEWRMKMSVEFDIPPNFIKQVYSDENVISSPHTAFLFGFDTPDKSICLLTDMLSAGIFDKYVKNPSGHCILDAQGCKSDGLFSFVMRRLAEDFPCENSMLSVAKAWTDRERALSAKAGS